MRPRAVITVSTALASLGLAINVAVAPAADRGHHPPPRLGIEGVVSDWDADAPSLTVEDPDVFGGPRAVRRALRALPELEIGFGPRTRLYIEDEDGGRERVTTDELVMELEESSDDLDVEAFGISVVPRPETADQDAQPRLTAKRIVLHANLPDDVDDDAPGTSGETPDPDGPPRGPGAGDHPDGPAPGPGRIPGRQR